MFNITQLDSDNFNRVCEQISRMGDPKNEHLQLIKKDSHWEFRTLAKPTGFSRFLSWFYKPKDRRFSTVSNFAASFFSQHKKLLANNEFAFKALERLSIRWANKSCAAALNALGSETLLTCENIRKKQLEDENEIKEMQGSVKQIKEKADKDAEGIRSEAKKQAEGIKSEAKKQADADTKIAANEMAKSIGLREQAEKEIKVKQELVEKELKSKKEQTTQIHFKAMQTFNELPIVKTKNSVETDLYVDVESKDCAIKCEDGNVKLHWILLKQVPYFQKAINPQFKQPSVDVKEKASLEDAPKNSFDLTSLDTMRGFMVDTVTAFTHFLYFKNAQVSSLSRWLELYRLADFTEYNELKTFCYEQIRSNIYKNPTILFEILPILITENHPACSMFLKIFIIYISDRFKCNPIEHIPFQNRVNLFATLLEKHQKKANDPAIDTALGVCYYQAIGVIADEAKALQLFSARSKEYAPARIYHGLAVDFIQKDHKKAHELYLELQHECPVAQYCLGKDFETGRGVDVDMDKAFQYYRRSAEQGYANGKWGLGHCYEKGIGVTANGTKAFEWHIKAAQQNQVQSLEYLQKHGWFDAFKSVFGYVLD